MPLRKYMSVIMDSVTGGQPDTYEVVEVNMTDRKYVMQELRSMKKITVSFEEADRRRATILGN